MRVAPFRPSFGCARAGCGEALRHIFTIGAPESGSSERRAISERIDVHALTRGHELLTEV
jgi:hypothetical protein